MRRTEKSIALLCILALSALLAGHVIPRRAETSLPYWPTHGWRTVMPEAQGFDSGKLADGLLAIRQKNLPIHSVLVVRNGDLVLDATFYPYDASTPHDLASVTKSITTTLIGIAADQGKLRLDDPVISFFGDRSIANRDGRKDRITIRHLASMSSGLACAADQNEQVLQAMQNSADWIQYTLDLPMADEPGSRFAYCSPGMHLLSAILQKSTGMTALDFACRYLFEPLGIKEPIWPSDPQGYTHGWGDLHLLPEDAAKIGYLWANGGMWDGRQVVSRHWVEDSVKVQMKTGQGDDYGYGWWLPRDSATGEYAAVGRGGQRIAVHRAVNLVLVVTGEGLEPSNATDLLAPALVDRDHALPANASGAESLTAALAAIEQAQVHPVPPLPPTARQISGKTWSFDTNDMHLKTVQLAFDEPSEGVIRIAFTDGSPSLSGRIGLDGAYRLGPGRTGLPAGFRGSWTDDATFTLDFDEIADNHSYLLGFHFERDRLTLEGRDRTSDASFSLVAHSAPRGPSDVGNSGGSP
jgi:CubicO group peptidase (beta-lactamase class C family)